MYNTRNLIPYTRHAAVSCPQMKDTGLTATLPVARVREDYLQSFRELQESPRPHELDQVRDIYIYIFVYDRCVGKRERK